MEVWDLYDAQKHPIGKSHIRGDAIPAGCFHLVVHVWIRNAKGEYLISQRSANRKSFPLKWECVGGSVLKGEDSRTAAVREVIEEVGLTLPADAGTLLFTQVRETYRGERYADILDAWLWEYDGEVCLGNATTDEVAQVKWMNTDHIRRLYEQGELVDSMEYILK